MLFQSITRKKSFCILCALFVLSAALMLGGCSGKKSAALSVDVAKLAGELNEKTVTSDTLTLASEQIIPSIYFVEAADLEQSCAYTSAGSTACEVAVMKFKEAAKANDAKKLLETRVANQSDLYASYNAGEVAKLEKAVIKVKDTYAVLVVCDDPAKAEEILKNSGF